MSGRLRPETLMHGAFFQIFRVFFEYLLTFKVYVHRTEQVGKWGLVPDIVILMDFSGQLTGNDDPDEQELNITPQLAKN